MRWSSSIEDFGIRAFPMRGSCHIGISASMPRRELGVRRQETGDGRCAREEHGGCGRRS
jgi:hypothetical protein